VRIVGDGRSGAGSAYYKTMVDRGQGVVKPEMPENGAARWGTWVILPGLQRQTARKEFSTEGADGPRGNGDMGE